MQAAILDTCLFANLSPRLLNISEMPASGSAWKYEIVVCVLPEAPKDLGNCVGQRHPMNTPLLRSAGRFYPQTCSQIEFRPPHTENFAPASTREHEDLYGSGRKRSTSLVESRN
jgi:hypothetical protein